MTAGTNAEERGTGSAAPAAAAGGAMGAAAADGGESFDCSGVPAALIEGFLTSLEVAAIEISYNMHALAFTLLHGFPLISFMFSTLPLLASSFTPNLIPLAHAS